MHLSGQERIFFYAAFKKVSPKICFGCFSLMRRRCLRSFLKRDCDKTSKPVKRNTAENVDSKEALAAAGKLESVC